MILSKILLAAAGVAAAVSASATTIDFSDQPVASQTITANPLTYGNATFSSKVGLRVLSAGGFYDRALCPNSSFACVGGLRIDFATPVNNVSFDVYQVDTTGLLQVTAIVPIAPGFVYRPLILPRGIGPTRVTLTGIADISQLILDGSTDEEGMLFDNFSFEPSGGGVGGVPEPTTWALLLSGFAVSGLALRRRRFAAA